MDTNTTMTLLDGMIEDHGLEDLLGLLGAVAAYRAARHRRARRAADAATWAAATKVLNDAVGAVGSLPRPITIAAYRLGYQEFPLYQPPV